MSETAKHRKIAEKFCAGNGVPPYVQAMIGEKYNSWSVLEFGHSKKVGGGLHHYAVCRCQCGTERAIACHNLKSGASKSCGCQRDNLTHGMSRRGKVHPVYRVWQEMLRRCYDSTRRQWQDYGGRGIQVCERWMDFLNFCEDMEFSWRKGLSIGRIDNDGHYCPENCRWETRKQQNNNTRRNRFVCANGKTQTLGQWSEETGMPYSLLLWRLDRGWEHDRIVNQPSNRRKE